jgi:N-ethylmaleimide reductase
MSDSDPIGLTSWLGNRLNDYTLAYWHVMRADFLGQQAGDVMTAARAAYRGALVGNMGYTPEEAAAAISERRLDAVAFGVPFLANPDLPERIRGGAARNEADATTFYTPGPRGYTDYPALVAE